MRALLLLLVLTLMPACAHRLRIVSVPTGAFVYKGNERIGTAPLDLRVPIFTNPKLSVRLPGYRTVNLRPGRRASSLWSFTGDALTFRWGRAVGLSTWSTFRVLMVPEHPTVAREALR